MTRRPVHLAGSPQAYRTQPGYDVPAVPAVAPPPGLAGAMVETVRAAMPQAVAMVPGEPAAAFGRVGLRGSGVRWPDPAAALMLAEALMPVAGSLSPEVPQAVRAAQVREPRSGGFAYATLQNRPWDSALFGLKAMAPGTVELAAGLVRELATFPLLADAMRVEGVTEAELATGRGRVHLALALAVSSVVVRGCPVALRDEESAAVVGLTLPVAVSALQHGPAPRGYAAALVEKRRVEYTFPHHTTHYVVSVAGRFGLVEGNPVLPLEEPANGLVTAVPGGLVVRTGAASGVVSVLVIVLAERPEDVVGGGRGWDEIVELSYLAVDGSAGLPTVQQWPSSEPVAAELTSPWPGPVRALVRAEGRDEPPGERATESYEIVLWPEPASPEVVHKKTDRLGHRLRGEPEPPPVEQPERVFEWVGRSVLSEAATVTVVTGADPESVVRGFGGDPAEPVSMRELLEDFGIDPWVAVLPVEGAVLAVEFNGWQGAQGPVLQALSRNGSASSSYWNVNAVRRLSFARRGVVLDSEEWTSQMRLDDPDVRAAVEGIDFDSYRNTTGKYLVPVARFTGYTFAEADYARIVEADVAYRILPLLPEHYPVELQADGTLRWAPEVVLGDDPNLLPSLPADTLRDLAWWAAGEAAQQSGMAAHHPVAESLARRGLTTDAERLARESTLEGRGEHHWMWMAFHEASNPDPLAAAMRGLKSAGYVFGTASAEFLARARSWIGPV
ncbi:DUF6461 domain-containing protein [Pseudonocardia sp. TRM90224]|uniref:DUF6461 domain-containing protein n=1 Tax=Pseudonocardia sp. TRM90224 TaxID=2812678 RepID=UPI001E5D100B|nr:DUF6461 domain-containing protein [Pseudonocardia sp. TRM90224]